MKPQISTMMDIITQYVLKNAERTSIKGKHNKKYTQYIIDIKRGP